MPPYAPRIVVLDGDGESLVGRSVTTLASSTAFLHRPGVRAGQTTDAEVRPAVVAGDDRDGVLDVALLEDVERGLAGATRRFAVVAGILAQGSARTR